MIKITNSKTLLLGPPMFCLWQRYKIAAIVKVSKLNFCFMLDFESTASNFLQTFVFS